MAKAGDISVSLNLDGAGKFERRVKGAASTLDALSGSSARYERAAKRASKQTSAWTSNLRDWAIILGLARSALENVSDLVFALPAAILRQNAMLERNEMLLTGVNAAMMDYASAQKEAKRQMQAMVDLSSASPYALEAVLDSYTKLRVSGVERTEQAVTALIGTMAKYGSTSEQLKRGSLAVQQMMGKGVLSMEELRQQLGEAVPGIMNIMSRSLNMPMQEMVKAISEGKVIALSSINAMFDEMTWMSIGAAQRMADTWDGLMNQIRNNATMFARSVGDAGFFEQMKGLAKEFRDFTSSAEGVTVARDLSDAMTTMAQSAAALAKLLAENIALLSALAKGFVALKVGQGIFAGLKTQATGFGNALEKERKNIQKMESIRARSFERWVEADEMARRRVENNAAKYADMSQRRRDAAMAQIAGDIREKENARMASMDRTLKSYKSWTSKVGRASQTLFSAMGGWSTVALAGITALVYAYDELIGKQNRAVANINSSKGDGATRSQYELYKKQIREDERRLNGLRSNLNQGGTWDEYGVFNKYDDNTIKLLEEKVEEYEKKISEATVNLNNAASSFMASAEKTGAARALNMLSDATQGMDGRYEREAKKIQDWLEKEGDQVENAQEVAGKRQLELRQRQFEELSQATSELEKQFLADQQKVLDKYGLTTVNNENIAKLSAKDAEIWNTSKGALEALRKELERYSEAVTSHQAEISSRKSQDKQMSAFEKTMLGYRRKHIADLGRISDSTRRNTRLQQEAQRINSGVYGTLEDWQKKALLDSARQADLDEAAIRRKKKLNELYKENQALLARADTTITRLQSKTAKKTNPFDSNELMTWYSTYAGELAKVNGLTAELKANMLEMTDAQRAEAQAKIDSMNTNLQSLAAGQAINTLLKEQKTATAELRTAEEQRAYELKEYKNNLAELGAEMKRLAPENSAQIDAMIQDLTKLKQAVFDRQTNGFERWSRQLDDLDTQIQDKMYGSLTTFADSFAQSMVDTNASFSAMIKSMTQDLQKFLIKMAMMKAIQSAFSAWGFGAGGGSTSYGSPVTDAATGAVMSPNPTPQDSMFGSPTTGPGFVGSMSAPMASPANVNIINQTGMNVGAESAAPRFDGEKMVVDVVMKAAARPGKFRNAMKGINQ